MHIDNFDTTVWLGVKLNNKPSKKVCHFFNVEFDKINLYNFFELKFLV